MIEVNLLPYRQTQRITRQKNIRVGISFFMILCVAILFIFYFQKPKPRIEKSKHVIPVLIPAQENRVSPSFLISDEKFFSKNNLHLVSLVHLQWNGYVLRNHKMIALIKMPNDATIPVSKGEIIGVESASIVSINDHEMILQIKNKTIKWLRGANAVVV